MGFATVLFPKTLFVTVGFTGVGVVVSVGTGVIESVGVGEGVGADPLKATVLINSPPPAITRIKITIKLTVNLELFSI